MNREVFLSILAMDSYQRGYATGINGLETPTFGPDGLATTTVKIGQARIVRDANDAAGVAQSASFYALSYTFDVPWAGLAQGTTVISYRGTDFDKGKELLHDVLYGWSSFTGLGTNSQFPLAEQFFNAVMNIPTGHSAFEIGGRLGRSTPSGSAVVESATSAGRGHRRQV